MEFRLLGSLELTSGGQPVPIAGLRTRAVLAMLLVNANRVVPADKLASEFWPGHQPDRAAANLQVRLSELRRALNGAGEAGRLVTQPPGYVLRVAADELDASRFEGLVKAGHQAIAEGNAENAVRLLDGSLSLWAGPALAEFDDLQFALAERARLDEIRLGALEAKLGAQLACGQHHETLAELERLTAEHPLRERLWASRMVALYRSGRQADALRAYRQLRATLVDQLGIEPGPELRDLQTRILRQDPDLGDLGTGGPAAVGWLQPETRYADCAGTHIAYQVLGDGPLDIVAVPGLVSHLDLWWQDQTATRFFRKLATLGRVIMFDKRDTGLSDSAPGDLSLEQRMDDVQAVMRACGSSRAVLFGYSEGGPMCLLYAATHPERVRSLVLAGAAARWTPAPGYPCGDQAIEMLAAFERLAGHGWGQGDSVEWYAPSRAHSAKVRRELARWERAAVSPGALLRLIRTCRSIDVRDVLSAVAVPALVIQRTDDRITPPYHGRYLAAHIANARYFEQPGDHLLWLGDTDAMFAEIELFLADEPAQGTPDRVLKTILCCEPTEQATAREFKAVAATLIKSHRGSVVLADTDRILATFDAPGRAIRCAIDCRDAAPWLGIRCGVHTGEVELLDDGIEGVCVDIAEHLIGLAGPSEILVTRTVQDLVVGSSITFADRGAHWFGEGPGNWQVFAVAGR